MEIVGHFVGLDANGREGHRIGGKIEILARRIADLFAENLTKSWLEMSPKFPATPYLVLPHAALRFVHRHSNRLAQRIAKVFDWKALLVESVARLMNRPEK